MNNDARLKGIAIEVSNRLQPSLIEVFFPVDKRVIRLRLSHTWGFMSHVAVYALTEMSGTDEKEMFYTILDFVLDQCPGRDDTLIVLGDFNAVTCIERAGYKICVGFHGFGGRNTNSSFLLNFCEIQKFENCRFLVSKTRASPLNLV